MIYPSGSGLYYAPIHDPGNTLFKIGRDRSLPQRIISESKETLCLSPEKYLNSADAVLAMYHDQGLPVLKSHGFGCSANITLGLPIVRTSVDHGTALDLAGKGIASVGSLQIAIQMALQISNSSSEKM